MRPSLPRFGTRLLAALVLGAVLTIVPRPALATERAVRVDNETPELQLVEDDGAADPTTPSTTPLPPEGATPQAETARLVGGADEVDTFTMIGVSFSGADTESGRIRTRDESGWAPWQALTNVAAGDDHGPDPGSAEAARARPASDPLWVADADGYELNLPPDAADVVVHLVRETEEVVVIADAGDEAEAAYDTPDVQPRATWGAAPYRGTPDVADEPIDRAVVHHTVNSNNYSAAQVPSLLRSIQAYHQDGRGWSDIGYNFVVDRFGEIWEGRADSLYEPVIGAHAQNYNTGSVGVAFLGEGSTPVPTAVTAAYGRLLGWKMPLHERWPTTNNIVGHRDVGQTTCPGNSLHNQLATIRAAAIAEAPAPGPFLDIPNGNVNAVAAEWAKDNGIAAGYKDGNFLQGEPISRGQFVVWLWRMAGEPEGSAHGLSDVPPNAWYRDAVRWAVPAGIITGFPDGTFRADKFIDRDAAAVQLWRFAGQPTVGFPHTFSDVNPGAWSEMALGWGQAYGLVTGYGDGTYRPRQDVSRGQTVRMLHSIRPFNDPVGPWAADGVSWARFSLIVSGYGDHTFRADNNVLRSQAAAWLWKLMDWPDQPAPPDHGFGDVSSGVWYEAALDWGTAAAWVDGLGDGDFHPGDAVDRATAVRWLWNVAGQPTPGTPHGFTDVPAGADYEDAASWAAEHGVVTGFGDNTFRGGEDVSRVQFAMMMYRLAGTAGAWDVTPPATVRF